WPSALGSRPSVSSWACGPCVVGPSSTTRVRRPTERTYTCAEGAHGRLGPSPFQRLVRMRHGRGTAWRISHVPRGVHLFVKVIRSRVRATCLAVVLGIGLVGCAGETSGDEESSTPSSA